MISRAALLLFIATAAGRRLLADAAYTTETLSFWWKRHGEERGFWSSRAVLENPFDYWADISVALGESQTWRASNPAGTVRLCDWRQTQNKGLSQLGGMELIGIWGMLP